ncbi:unnamed protein product [Didymodactylos carnosus]|uniref:Reverse transcriptase domain-containing protein n=1 Tax=Didymodactylos carnosus TaxID=1234261 RepID=A0A815LSW2_9BILA|nr:unnamed protein product [Didymodactylos carnosus]CAF4298424.1 unnamed protein product [Didymodactylos carnosus]
MGNTTRDIPGHRLNSVHSQLDSDNENNSDGCYENEFDRPTTTVPRALPRTGYSRGQQLRDGNNRESRYLQQPDDSRKIPHYTNQPGPGQRKKNEVYDDEMTIDEKYSQFVEHVRELGTKYFQQENNAKKRKEWLTDEILDMVKKKSEAYLHWQNRLGKHNEQKYRSKYRALAKLVKRKIEARQFEYWDEISCEIENAIKQHDPATAYAMIRRLRGRNKNMDNTSIQDKNGKMLLNSKDRLSRWREYFCELLNVHTVIDLTILQQIPIPAIDKAEETRQDKPPSLPEVVQAIKQMKSRKAPGKDDVTAELLKAGGLELALWLHQIIVDVWINEQMVEDWTMAILIRLYKNKGDKRICDNYRGISLLIVVSKIFSRIVLNRIQGLLDKKLLDQQAGFRPNRSTVDQIFTLKMIMEKSQEYNKSLFMCFIDIQKAYDSVNREL